MKLGNVSKVSFVAISIMVVLLISGCDGQPIKPVDSTSIPEPTIIRADLGFKTKLNSISSIEDKLPMVKGGEGLGSGIFDKNGNSLPKNLIQSDGSLQFFLTLYSYLPKDVSYKLIQFIDFNQSPLILDGMNRSDGYNFTMPANSKADFPLTLSINQEGLHEILFIFVISVNNKTMSEEERFDFNPNLYCSRLFVNVKNNSPTPPALECDTVSVFINEKFNTILLNKNRDQLYTVWLTDKTRPQTEIPCYLHIGSAKEKEKRQYAIMLLNEWKQVEINNGKKVLFIELDPNKEAIIPTKIKIPKEEGVYDITPIVIPNPYDYINDSFVSTSFRTGITVSGSD